MLPTLGLFRAIPCPYYVVGLCERPHCTFRHSRSDVEAARREASGQENFNETETVNHNGQSTISNQASVPQSSAGSCNRIEKDKQPTEKKAHREKRANELTDAQEEATQSKKLKLEKTSDSSSTVANKKDRRQSSDKRDSSSSPSKSSHRNDGSHSSKHRKSSHKDKSDHAKRGHRGDKKESKLSESSKEKSHSDNYRSGNSSRSSCESRTSKKSSTSSSTSKSSPHRSKSRHSSSSTKSGSRDGSLKSESVKSTIPAKVDNDNLDDAPVVTIGEDDLEASINDGFEEVKDIFLCPSDEEEDTDEIALECFTLFKNYSKEDSCAKPFNLESLPEIVSNSEDNQEKHVGKRRIAHENAEKVPLVKPPAAVPPKRKESLAEQLQRRFQAAKETIVSQTVSPVHASAEPATGNTSSKKRIAHVSNANALLKPYSKVSNSASENSTGREPSSSVGTSSTIPQTAQKGEKRIAHIPSKVLASSVGSVPTVIPDSKSKVPILVRQKFMEQIFRECVQIYNDGDSARTRALEEEKILVSKCNSKQVYTCSAVNLITRLRKEYREAGADSSSGPILNGTSKTVSHNEILAGKAGSSISWSIEKKLVYRPVGVDLYAKMTEYLLSTTEVEDHGFPRKCPKTFKGCSGLAVIKVKEDAGSKRSIDDPHRKVCDRCGVTFVVDDHGFPLSNEPCTYHAGRKFGRRTRTGNAEARYNCCDGEANSIGCCTAACHVHASKSNELLKNFICAALEPGKAESMGSEPWDVFAVDCEMVYTTAGSELARATFVGIDGKILYDTLVKPPHSVLDYNTRYSGIDESMLMNTSTTISDVHLKILANVKPNSIIIGHSLENDLIALKLIHNNVIDTSVVFPHKRGLPFKRALRNLSADYLGKIIQVGDGGHDSAEDARAALDLMLWKVKNDSSRGLKRNTSALERT